MANTYKDNVGVVLNELNASLSAVDAESIERLMDLVMNAEKVFFVGVGRVLLSLQAIAKRWAHLGIECHIVGEITEPAITDKDVLIVGSGSGKTLVPVGIAKIAHSKGAKIVHIGSNRESDIKEELELMVRIPVRTKYYLDDEIDSIQPMTSLFEQSLLLMGDIIAMMIIEKKGLDLKGLWKFHANLE